MTLDHRKIADQLLMLVSSLEELVDIKDDLRVSSQQWILSKNLMLIHRIPFT